MPGEKTSVNWLEGTGRWQTKEKVVYFWLVFKLDRQVYFKVLSNAADDGAEGVLELPINFIVKHVEENHCLVSDVDLKVTK